MARFDPQPERRRCVVLVGASGSGKTVIAQRVAESLGCALYDTDALILQSSKRTRISDIFDSEGESRFRALEEECVRSILSDASRAVIATGGGLPAIPGMMDRLNSVGVSVYLRARLETLWKRLNADPRQLEDRPLLRNGGQTKLLTLLASREAIYARAAMTLDTDLLSVDEVSRLIVSALALD